MINNTMTNGYATDESTGSNSNKRVRHADEATAIPNANAPSKRAPATIDKSITTPIGLGYSTADRYIASLHRDLQPSFLHHAHAVLLAYATYFRSRKSYEKEKNDNDQIPKAANICLPLKPRSVVAKQEGFKSLVRETVTVVENCRQLLKIQWMKCAEMNVASQQHDIARAFAESLPKIAELLLAEDGIEHCDRHRVVADFLQYKKADVLSFLGLTEADSTTFMNEYCNIHSLDSFPTPSAPSLFFVSLPVRAQQQEAMPLRGGNDDQSVLDPSTHQQIVRNPYTPTPIAAAAAASRQSTAAAAAAATTPIRNGLEMTAEQLAASSARFESAHGHDYLDGLSANEFDYGGPSQGQDQAPIAVLTTTPANPNVTPNNLDRQFQGADNTDDASMANADDGADIDEATEPTATTEPNPTPEQQQQAAAGQQPAPAQQPTPLGGFESALRVKRRGELVKIHYCMIEIYDQAFKKPRTVYDKQVQANETTLRIKKVAKNQMIKKKADQVAEAIQAEGTVDPKTVRVMIIDEVDRQFREVEAVKNANKKNAQQSQAARNKQSQRDKSPSSKKAKGAQRRGGAHSSKKKLPSQPSNDGARPRGAGGNPNASSAASSKDGEPSSRRKSRKNGGASKTKRTTSSDRSRRK